MNNGQTVGLGMIIWRVMNNKLVTDLSYDQAAENAIEALRLIGAPLVYKNKVSRPAIKVIDYKAALPLDLIEIRGIKLLRDTYEDGNEVLESDIALREATDLYHQDTDCNDPNINCEDKEFTYEIQQGIITTSFRKGDILISYKGLMLDKDGYPEVPNNEKVLMALEYYIIFRYLEGLWAMGKITDKVFQYYEQKKLWYMGAANASLQMPTLDKLETTMNSVTRILHNNWTHSQFFEKMGRKERIKRYN